MSRPPVAVVFGGTRIGNRPQFTPGNGLEDFLDVLALHKVSNIDTAQSYGDSEGTIGKVKAGNRFTVDTKWSPLWAEPDKPWATGERITTTANESLEKLQLSKVDIFYLHRPDPNTPITETLSAINEVFLSGSFRRLGLSGFPAAEVEAIHGLCVDNGYPLPKVYQGSYNPLSRQKEGALLPTLRKLGMSFYAYGTSAGGFLGKTVARAEDMARGTEYVSPTCRPYVGNAKFLQALARWNAVAEAEGVSGAELAYRWIAYHSVLDRDAGDAMIIGASSPNQLDETLRAIEKGPLSDKASTGVHDIWEGVKEP